jgi:hypothetical protein
MGVEAQQGRQTAGRHWFGRGAMVALLWLAPMLFPSAAGADVPDVGCPGPADAPTITRSGDQREAQVFTPTRSGALTRVTVEITNPGPSLLDPSNDFLVQLLLTDKNGAPAADVLAQASVPNASVPVGSATLDVTFSPAPDVVGGHPYAVLIGRPGTFTSFQPHTRSGDQCGGAAFWSSGPGHAYAAEAAGTDMVFQTYVKPGNKFAIVGKKGRLYARVPGPGGVQLHKNRFVRRSHSNAQAVGDVLLKIKLTPRAIAHILATRRLNLPLVVTYSPVGGDPNTEKFKIKIRI